MVFCVLLYNTIIYINVGGIFPPLTILFNYFCLKAEVRSYQASDRQGE